MKKTIFTFALMLLVNLVLQAQTLVYNENLSGTNSNLTSLSSTWVGASTTPNTIISASGGRYITTSNSTSNATTLFLKSVKTAGFNNLTVAWNARKTTGTPTISLAYSLDGTTFTTITNFTDVAANSTWAAVNNGTAIALPEPTAEGSELTLRWTVTVSNTTNYSMDDIVIMGTPLEGSSTFSWASRANNEDPFVVSSPTAAAPYTKDGVSMRLTRQSATGVNLTTAVLSDATFQNPTRSLTLIQNGANATNGTVITNNFSAAVTDLTFTLFDVDRSGGQFRDQVKIEGYLNGTLVPLLKKDVITTTLNEFVESTGTVQATATGTEAASTSANGNVVIKFSNPVNRIVLRYHNIDGTGNQGVGINSFSWRLIPAALPVSLTAFNATLTNGQTQLKWATASEKNNDRFEIERSLNGRTFEAIGSVKGNGNASAVINYAFADAKPAPGTNYYRLKQVDFDGTFAYSKIVTVKNNQSAQPELTIYPVPATSEITVSLSGNAAVENVKIFNLNGNLVKEMTAGAKNQLEVNVPISELPAGYYVVQVTSPATTLTRKIVKQ